jgi:protein phosphatase PTC1
MSEDPKTPPLTESVDEQKNEKVEESSKEPTVSYTSIADFGVCSDQNWKYRRRMEDAHYMEDKFNGDGTQGFFAIYDGHGGKEAAIFAADNLHKLLAEEINKEADTMKDPEKVLQALKRSFLATDEKLKTAVPSHHGCTAVTCIVTGSGDNRHLYTANVGDARAVLCRDGKAIRLTEEHKASDTVEAKRITDGGGFIIHGRVNGQIIITRSLGDHLMKEFIIGDPHLSHEKLTSKDTWLIVACDGLWDVVDDQPAVDFVLENASLPAPQISKKLLIKALQDGTTDNLSIMVIKL